MERLLETPGRATFNGEATTAQAKKITACKDGWNQSDIPERAAATPARIIRAI